MPIHVPGYRPATGRAKSMTTKRSIVAVLSLTAMVDLFTVITVFLLQNYNQTGAVLNIPQGVKLPQAHMSKELTPAHVVTITRSAIMLGKKKVASTRGVSHDPNWMIRALYTQLHKEILDAKSRRDSSLRGKLNKAVNEAKSGPKKEDNDYRKVTVEADRGVPFSVIKRVMYTATEAGAGEINFAVLKKPKKG